MKTLLVVFLILWPTLGQASGWNDFEREIGHGFKIWKTDGDTVCLSFEKYSALVCGDVDEGVYGQITGYAFTDENLLVRTTGVKPTGDPAHKFTTDWDREYFFIVKKEISYPYSYLPNGPLDRDKFHADPAVPSQIQWERPTRFASKEGEISLPVSIIITIIAWLVILASTFGWPAILVFVAWRIYRWRYRSQQP